MHDCRHDHYSLLKGAAKGNDRFMSEHSILLSKTIPQWSQKIEKSFDEYVFYVKKYLMIIKSVYIHHPIHYSINFRFRYNQRHSLTLLSLFLFSSMSCTIIQSDYLSYFVYKTLNVIGSIFLYKKINLKKRKSMEVKGLKFYFKDHKTLSVVCF